MGTPCEAGGFPGDPRTQGKFWFGPDHGALVRRGCWFGLSRPQVGRAELGLGLLWFVFGLCWFVYV